MIDPADLATLGTTATTSHQQAVASCQAVRVEFADALVADELWGWPVKVLDRLLDLRRRAWAGAISIEEWREQDAAHRTGLPVVDTNEVKEFQTNLIMNGPLDTPKEARSQLTGRLTVLAHPAPSDEELWEQLSATHEALADPRLDRKLKEIERADRDRITDWLARPGSGIDPVTGLSWSWIVRYRVVEDPDLGRVPQYVDSARQLALSDASAAERQRADLLAPNNTSTEWKLTASTATLNQNRLTWLPRLILDAAADSEVPQSLVTNLTGLWSDPAVQRLLMEETSRGWPAPFDQEPDHRSSDA